jgi:hypothetical protein
MRYLLSPFFAIGLIATTLPSLALLTIIKASPYRSFIISFVIFISTTTILLTNIYSGEQPPSPLPSKEKILEQKNTFENWLSKQPTHRDILLNLSKIEQALANEQGAQNYKNRAFELDPNNEIFKED